MNTDVPLVSVVLTTRDRPRFLRLALACYRHQTYPRRELIVVDDGQQFPADPERVQEVGGLLVRTPPGTPLGTKLNRGIREAKGVLCQKMDDDDWYGPAFLETMVRAWSESRREMCHVQLVALMSFLFFDLARWEIRRSIGNNFPGASLLFAREDWEEHAFRALPRDEDVWFLLDQTGAGAGLLPVINQESFLAVRHQGSTGDRGHTWTHQSDGRTLEDYLEERPLYPKRPEDLLPDWALGAYRDLRRELLAEAEGNKMGPRGLRGLVPSPRRFPPPWAKDRPKLLILTPVKDAVPWIPGYCRRVSSLTYPHASISLGFLESDSRDDTLKALNKHVPALRKRFRHVGVWKRDFGYRVPDGMDRRVQQVQRERRAVLAKARNHLLFHALDDEDWVLWLDVDVIEYPNDVIEQLLETRQDIVQPHCVLDYGGRTFDRNGWRDQGRLHLDDLRAEGDLVELDAVGGTMLLVRADLHRDGLVFPPFPYGIENPRTREGRGEIETEGLGIMAQDMGLRCWGLPHLEIRHVRY